MERREEKGGYGGGGHDSVHVLALPYPSQGHINPMLQFCKRLLSTNSIKPTLLLTNFISNSTSPSPSSSSVQFDTISDGYDQGGFAQASDIHAYITTLQQAGSRSLAQLIHKYSTSPHPVKCVIYDSMLPWALDVAKQYGLVGASFFTQPCAVNLIYYHVYHRLLTLPISSSSFPLSIRGMPLLQLEDMPSFIYMHGSYPAYFHLVLNQFSNLHEADYVLVNTFYELEDEVVNAMSKISPVMTIGPTIPSFYLDDDDRVEDDDDDYDYGLHLYHLNDSSSACNWLSSKPTGSVVYVSFGSMACLGADQMEELAWGLRAIGKDYYYLWVVRTAEEGKLPENFRQEIGDKGLLVSWSPQLQVLSSKAIGCFFSHAGWNSTIEALILGVPMVVMPQWTDQTTNAKFVQDVWKVGIRVKVDTELGLVGRQEIESCTREVMEGKGRKEMQKNAFKWRDLAKEAIRKGGTSDKNINQFVSKVIATPSSLSSN